MDELIFKHLKEYNESIKENTIIKYVRNILNLKDYLNYDKNDLQFITHTDNILKVLDEKNYSIQTKNSYIVSCLQVAKAFKFDNKLINFYIQKIKEYNNIIKSKYAKQEKSEKQEKNWVSWDKLHKFYKKYRSKVRKMRLTKRKKLDYNEFLMVQNMVLLSCYFSDYNMNPPRRNIYGSLMIHYLKKSDDVIDDTKNYLLIQSSRIKYFLFNDYKTVKNYGKLKLRLNKNLNNDVNLYLRFNKTKFFMPSKNQTRAMSTSDITKRLQEIFKKHLNKNISSQMIRQSLMSWIHRNTPSNIFLTKLSQRMGHSLLTGLKKYTKKDSPKKSESP